MTRQGNVNTSGKRGECGENKKPLPLKRAAFKRQPIGADVRLISRGAGIAIGYGFLIQKIPF